MKHAAGYGLLALLLGLAIVSVDSSPTHAQDKVALCHFPPGNPENFHTITVSPSAVIAHIRNQGDVPGQCCRVDGDCDDGNACTTDRCIDNVCANEPLDCNDSDPCTSDSCDPAAGCIHEPVACEPGQACNSDTGDCLPIGQCPCWLGSNPIDVVEAAFQQQDPFPCVEPMSLTCNGSNITLSGGASGPNGATASFSVKLSKPHDDYACAPPSSNGFGACECPPPPSLCQQRQILGDSPGEHFPQPTTCVEEFEAACAALQ